MRQTETSNLKIWLALFQHMQSPRRVDMNPQATLKEHVSAKPPVFRKLYGLGFKVSGYVLALGKLAASCGPVRFVFRTGRAGQTQGTLCALPSARASIFELAGEPGKQPTTLMFKTPETSSSGSRTARSMLAMRLLFNLSPSSKLNPKP